MLQLTPFEREATTTNTSTKENVFVALLSLVGLLFLFFDIWALVYTINITGTNDSSTFRFCNSTYEGVTLQGVRVCSYKRFMLVDFRQFAVTKDINSCLLTHLVLSLVNRTLDVYIN